MLEALQKVFTAASRQIIDKVEERAMAGVDIFDGPSDETTEAVQSYVAKATPMISTLTKCSAALSAYCTRHKFGDGDLVMKTEDFDSAKLINGFLESFIALSKFVIQGQLRVEDARLQQSVSPMGPVMVAYHKLSSMQTSRTSGQDFCSVITTQIFPWIRSLAGELHSPLEQQLFSAVFSHSHLEVLLYFMNMQVM